MWSAVGGAAAYEAAFSVWPGLRAVSCSHKDAYHPQHKLWYTLRNRHGTGEVAKMESSPISVRRLSVFVSAAALFVNPSNALAQSYKATELGLLPGGTSVSAAAINNAGQLAGGADSIIPTPPHAICDAAVIWNGTTPASVISCDPNFGSFAVAINNFGVVLVRQSQLEPFVWSPTLDNRLGYDFFFSANGINDSGKIAGSEGIPFGGPQSVAIFWASPYATSWTVLPQLPGNEGGGSFANGINNAGQIVGGSIFFPDPPSAFSGTRHATLWRGARVTDLGTLGGTESSAAAIADSGQIVGWADTSSGAQHAASWIGTKVTDLGTLGGTKSQALAVNSSGEIVGSADTSGGAQHAALFAGGKVIDLNSALNRSLAPYITLMKATGVNESGWIVANGVDNRTGQDVAFLLTPNIKVLNCFPGDDVYEVVNPSRSVSSAVSPNSSGNPVHCALPSSEPAAWYIKTTSDGGETWQWKYTLKELGLGSIPPNAEVLNCTRGSDHYEVVKPSNSVSSAVSPNSLGNPVLCTLPSSEPATWYIKTTTDFGATWHWETLSSFGLGH
jgi:probable HAF family extracellular repeat protein